MKRVISLAINRVIQSICTAGRKFFGTLLKQCHPFTGSKAYWNRRYEKGGNSGIGSYGKLAEFKAEVLNNFVKEERISTIIEFGCGDGNQLRLTEYPSYIGFDISKNAVSLCRNIFEGDERKIFKLMDEYAGEMAELTLSLDVIYHLVEDAVFIKYMERLFNSSEKFVVIYSSNMEDQRAHQAPHVRHRRFSTWIQENKPQWKFRTHIPNKYPLTNDGEQGSFADFYIYEKIRWEFS